MAEFWYNVGKARMWHGHASEIDIVTGATCCILALQVDEEDDTEETVGTLLAGSAAEVGDVGTNYTGGFEGASRLSLAGKGILVDQGNTRAEFDCDDLTWTAITQNVAEEWVAFVLFDELTNDAGSYLLAHLEPTGVPLTANGSDIKITINAEGLLHIT